MAPGVASKFLVASVLLLVPGATALPSSRRHAIVGARAPPEVVVGHFVAANLSFGSAHAKTAVARLLDEISVLRGEMRGEMKSTDPHGEWGEQMDGLDKQLEELARMLSALQAQEHRQHRENVDSHANIQAEIDRLREAVRRIEGANKDGGADGAGLGSGGTGSGGTGTGGPGTDRGTADGAQGASADVHTGGSSGAPVGPEGGVGGNGGAGSDGSVGSDGGAGQGPGAATQGSGATSGGSYEGGPSAAEGRQSAAGSHGGGADRADQVDVDMAMPYGDLEPFGREDTAQELTEDSMRQSNEMVDQLERAEVAEEKRAVFRALTRLRGAAITSYDGIARSQTGNMDDYARKNQWRTVHPVHHLADEEADVSKWAFPDNAED